jgi:ribosomal protein S18 acetylase RimI-like enzyme
MNIKRAVEADAPNVAQVHVQAWQAAYRGVVPDAYLDSVSIEKREVVWRESIKRGIPELWVADIHLGIVGWVAFGPSRDSDAEAGAGELEAIYVAPEHWATGIGRALWLVARRRLMELGFSSATLWVLADNARAIRFYRAAGFQPNLASQKEISLGGKSLREVRYEMSFG